MTNAPAAAPPASAGEMPHPGTRREETEPASVHHNSSVPELIASPGERRTTELSPAQLDVIAHLAQGSSVSAAARAAGLHRTTIHHWQRMSIAFNAALEEARKEFAEALADELHDLACEAVRTLRDLLTNPDTTPAVRLRTALAILNRPQFPQPGWNLPAGIRPEHEDRLLQQMAAVEAEYDSLRTSRTLAKAYALHHNSSENGLPDVSPAAAAPAPVRKPVEPSRNSLCPCGSGKKYKRCCGQSAAFRTGVPSAA